MSSVESAESDELVERLAGKIFFPGDPGYEDARVGRVFNARRPARFPAAVLHAETDDDVVGGVRLARVRGWRIAVRAGGHSWAAWSVRDDALLIDLGQLREISLDTDTGVVRVGPAVKGGHELNPYLAAHGLFFPGGHCPTVGVGGFLLQGGMGWNARGWGWATEQVVAVDVVTAAGELVRADQTRNSDLYWAARGAGPGFFGVVTRFHLRTRPLPKALAHSVYVYPMELFDEVVRWISELHTSVSPDVEIVVIGMTPPTAPDGASAPSEPAAPVLVVTALAFTDRPEAAAAVLLPFEQCPVVDQALDRQFAKPTTIAEQLVEQERMNPAGHRYAVDNAWVESGTDAAVPALRDVFATLPTPRSFSIWFSMAPLRPLPDMALSLQSDVYVASYVVWSQPSDDERCRAWLAEQMRRLEPVTIGQYLGDCDLATRSVRFLGDAQWRRLQAIREHHDPTGLFVGYLANDEVELNTNHWQQA